MTTRTYHDDGRLERLECDLPTLLIDRVVRAFPHRFRSISLRYALQAAVDIVEVLVWLETLVRICSRLRDAGHLARHELELLEDVERKLRDRALGAPRTAAESLNERTRR